MVAIRDRLPCANCPGELLHPYGVHYRTFDAGAGGCAVDRGAPTQCRCTGYVPAAHLLVLRYVTSSERSLVHRTKVDLLRTDRSLNRAVCGFKPLYGWYSDTDNPDTMGHLHGCGRCDEIAHGKRRRRP